MTEPTVKCDRCRVTIETAKVAMPGRCADHRCPLNSVEVNMKLAVDWARSVGIKDHRFRLVNGVLIIEGDQAFSEVAGLR